VLAGAKRTGAGCGIVRTGKDAVKIEFYREEYII